MKKVLLLLLVVTSIKINAQGEAANDTPFNCDYNAYLFQYNDVYAIDLASGNSYNVATDVTEGNINAVAYNPADGYIWGSLSTPAKTIVRIGKNFQTETFYINELPTNSRYVGDVSSSGIYYLKGGGTTYYAINVNPESENYGNYLATKTLSLNINIHDWAFNAVDSFLYTVEKKTNNLYRINAETGTVQNLGVVPILSGLNYTYGAVYFDASGRFYVSANQTGTIYVIQSVQDLNGTNNMESNLFAFGPSSSQNDGARCPTAPVPQEDCTNGIDDDGDGLIDCEDPSCSGYAACPVIEASNASSANAGGLESNNRLSELITKRNFNRTKTSYKFDKYSAKKLTKSSMYGKSNSGKGKATLADFIPFGTINEDAVIESTPSDLIGITNATEIYSVDYLKNDNAIASILLLKTENGVYEHTKYICDRLLGAELLSVSTVIIKDQEFIKALIRNIDGSLEFVLSLSAKSINNNANFSVESHWNLDKYQDSVEFYNFQIWSNSLDDLLQLGEEVLNLLDVKKPITEYNNSTPPSVFVKKGRYYNGKLALQIVNTNRTGAVVFDGGLRSTETEQVEYVSTSIDLDGSYITNVEVDAGNLFDIGFRIGDGVATPDDLFMSDGPWGYDDADATVTAYSIEENQGTFDDNSYPVERNIALTATTNNYVAIYRALTPKFNPIDLTAYNSLQFKAKGTGTVIVRLVRESVSNWEAQYKATITLTENLSEYAISFNDFKTTNGSSIVANDVTSIVFTMLSENGTEETKEMNFQEVHFATSSQLSTTNVNGDQLESNAIARPNPMRSNTLIQFIAQANEEVDITVYNQLGVPVKQISVEAIHGENSVLLTKENLSSGLYLIKIKSNTKTYKTIKLVVK